VEDIKNLILDKAKERLERFGYKKTTMDEISRDCKISKKTIYQHFTDKEDMFKCLFLRELNKTMEILLSRIRGVSDPLERLILLTRTAVPFLNQDHFITKVLKDDDLFLAVNRKYHEFVDEKVISIVAEIIREGKEQGKFRDVNEKIVAYAGFRLFQAFSYARTGPLCKDESEQNYTDVLIDIIVNVLVKK
jgi:AcrR family transcriptional regulator